MKKKLVTSIGLLLLAAALFLSLWNLYDESRAGREAEQLLQEIQDIKDPNAMPQPEYLTNPDMPMPTFTVDGKEYIGTIQIPDLELELPVFSQWDYPSLKQAPCRYSGSAYLDDMILMGHDYKRHFGKIKSLPMGTQIIFVDGENNRFVYEAKEAEVLDATAIEEMKQGEWDLTLFTCTKDGNARYALRCDRISDAE